MKLEAHVGQMLLDAFGITTERVLSMRIECDDVRGAVLTLTVGDSPTDESIYVLAPMGGGVLTNTRNYRLTALDQRHRLRELLACMGVSLNYSSPWAIEFRSGSATLTAELPDAANREELEAVAKRFHVTPYLSATQP